MVPWVHHVVREGYVCPLTGKRVTVQVKEMSSVVSENAVQREPEVCSNIGVCGCQVVEIVSGMSYQVDWRKCSLYQKITDIEQ